MIPNVSCACLFSYEFSVNSLSHVRKTSSNLDFLSRVSSSSFSIERCLNGWSACFRRLRDIVTTLGSATTTGTDRSQFLRVLCAVRCLFDENVTTLSAATITRTDRSQFLRVLCVVRCLFDENVRLLLGSCCFRIIFGAIATTLRLKLSTN